MTFHARQVQQHREACRAFGQRADRRAAETQDDVSFPVTRHRPVTLNARPRKTLGWKTPAEALDECLSQIDKHRVATTG